MAHAGHPPLDNGENFPWMTLSAVDGSTLRIPDDTNGRWTVFLVYRGHW